MQITESRKQILLGVQTLRAMASSPSYGSPTTLDVELSIASTASSSPACKVELPHTEYSSKQMMGVSVGDRRSRPAQLELLPLRPACGKAVAAGEQLSVLGRGWTSAMGLRGIDVNRLPSSSSASDDGGEEEIGRSARKKLRLSKEQSALLEESFREQSTLNPRQKIALAKQLNLRPRQVEVWFQNRRARTKLKQTEVDCELLRRCCESLTEENRRLQKEVAELRALKVGAPCVISHDFHMPLPAATLTMCASCERLCPRGTASTPSPSPSAHGGASTKLSPFPLNLTSQTQQSAAC